MIKDFKPHSPTNDQPKQTEPDSKQTPRTEDEVIRIWQRKQRELDSEREDS